MSAAFRRDTLVSRAIVACGVALIAGCNQPGNTERPSPATHPVVSPSVPPPAPSIPSDELLPPATPLAQLTPSSALVADTARERHVDVDTHGAEVDVRALLDFVAGAGNFRLVYAPGINRRVRVTLNDVPASVALTTLLSLANLTIEGATPAAGVPASNSIVFYELPVAVDSLSADAIMKRFGVGPAIAELIVKSRVTKP
jgi:hypothetical protein